MSHVTIARWTTSVAVISLSLVCSTTGFYSHGMNDDARSIANIGSAERSVVKSLAQLLDFEKQVWQPRRYISLPWRPKAVRGPLGRVEQGFWNTVKTSEEDAMLLPSPVMHLTNDQRDQSWTHVFKRFNVNRLPGVMKRCIGMKGLCL